MSCQTDLIGNKRWYNENGRLHRSGGLAAVEFANGSKEWYDNGERYRSNDLPTAEYITGTKKWHHRGKLHRLNDLPAIEYISGIKYWYENGERHRLGGLPATEFPNGDKQWYIYGREYTYKKVCTYYEILERFGRYCLKKIKMRPLKLVRFANKELLCMPAKGRYSGGEEYHKTVNYFINM